MASILGMTACSAGDHIDNQSPAVRVTGVSLNKNTLTLKAEETETLVATVEPAAATNKKVTWESTEPEVASVEDGVIVALARGETSIIATTHDGLHSAVCELQVLPKGIAVTGITLNKTNIGLLVGDMDTLVPTVQPADASVKDVAWSSNNHDVATVSTTGLVTGTGAGVATITATTADGGKTATCQVTVTASIRVTDVELEGVIDSSATISLGETLTLTAVVLPTNATNKNVRWDSLEPRIATVTNTAGNNSQTTVRGVSPGGTIITVTTQDGDKKAFCYVIVEGQTSTGVTGVTLNKNVMQLALGGRETLVATVAPPGALNKKVLWESDDDTVASVKDGVVTGIGLGKAKITATTEDGAKTAECAVTVVVATTMDVYVAGYRYDSTLRKNVATLWKNGTPQTLGREEGRALSVFVDGQDVYVAGWEINDEDIRVATVWINGEAWDMSDGKFHAEANSVTVSGPNVWAAGWENYLDLDLAVAWKNGMFSDLNRQFENKAEALSVFAYEGNVYIAGYEESGSGDDKKKIATLWKNDAYTRTNLSDGQDDAEARSVFVADGIIYAVGTENGIPTLWVDDEEPIKIAGLAGDANSVYVKGENIYVAGRNNSGRATLWVNDESPAILSTESSRANSVFVAGGHVFVAGWVNGRAAIWIDDDDAEELSLQGEAFSVFAIPKL